MFEEPQESLSIEVVTDPSGAPVLSAAGEVDVLTAEPLSRELTALLDQRRTGVVVDLTGVTLFTSAGLAVLVRAQRRAERDGIALAVVAGRVTARTLEMTGVHRMLSLFASTEAALHALSLPQRGRGAGDVTA
ncbi:STAS domain-containing protein [Umezawaea beigongshangensis]|uniref:STAS domain-containing protein n=1 Tax=Umezawaea beigongshangensis TaxID=2780383 RepID=UPI0018F17EED|nr:STAS domain-containing protein [Umezawaea beigongshangensis]